MSEEERRRKYRWNHVMIDTPRVLSPQFDDAVVYLTGAQLEMLRNITQYLERRETYVSEYNPGYYLTPTIAEFDGILAIVADLEEVLMGNPNTVWGYKEQYFDEPEDLDADAGYNALDGTVVPAGEVYRVESIRAYDQTSTCGTIEVLINVGGTVIQTEILSNPPANTRIKWDGMCTLKEDDFIRIAYWGVTVNDVLKARIRGYKVQVPE